MDAKNNIIIAHGRISKNIISSQRNIEKKRGVENITEATGRISKPNGIAHDNEIIWMTRRRVITVKYFKGFTTAI